MPVDMMYGVGRSGQNDELMHYGRSKRDGAKVGSGRYRLGSGEDPRAPLTNEEKEHIIKTGDAKAAYERRIEFTNDELQAVKTRFNLEKEIKNLDPVQIKTARERMEKASNYLSTIVKLTSYGIILYNNAAKTINAFSDANLPTIGTGEKKTSSKKD